MTEFSDEDLIAYHTGDLDAERGRALETALGSDPDLERRLMALDPLAPVVAQAFHGIPEKDRLDGLMPDDKPVVDPRSGWPRMAAMLVAGALIGAAAMALRGDRDQALMADWREQVAAYQVLYVAETVENIQPTQAGLNTQFARAQEVLGLDLKKEILADLSPLDLRRAQILGYQGRPLVQVAFRAPDGSPIAFCIIRGQGSGSTPRQMSTLAGLSSASWSTDGYEFLLIGGQDSSLIRDISDRIAAAYSSG